MAVSSGQVAPKEFLFLPPGENFERMMISAPNLMLLAGPLREITPEMPSGETKVVLDAATRASLTAWSLGLDDGGG